MSQKKLYDDTEFPRVGVLTKSTHISCESDTVADKPAFSDIEQMTPVIQSELDMVQLQSDLDIDALRDDIFTDFELYNGGIIVDSGGFEIKVSESITCKAENNGQIMTLGQSFFKRFNEPWALGEDEGSNDGSTISERQEIRVYMIAKADGTTDLLTTFDTTPSLPTDFISYREIARIIYTRGDINYKGYRILSFYDLIRSKNLNQSIYAFISDLNLLPYNYISPNYFFKKAGITIGLSTIFAKDDTNTYDIVNLEDDGTTFFYKNWATAWSRGYIGGALDTGSVADNTQYYVFLIFNPNKGLVDMLVSISQTAPTMPSGYVAKRIIGIIKTGNYSSSQEFKVYNYPSDNSGAAGAYISGTHVQALTATWQAITAAFVNDPLINFTLGTNSLIYNGPSKWYKIDISTSVESSLASQSVFIGINYKPNGGTFAIHLPSVMSTFCRNTGEQYNLSSNFSIFLNDGDEIQLTTFVNTALTAYFYYYTTTINPLIK